MYDDYDLLIYNITGLHYSADHIFNIHQILKNSKYNSKSLGGYDYQSV